MYPIGSPFCTSWSNLPEFYDDCETAGVNPEDNFIELESGTSKAPDIQAGHDYYGYWRFKNQRGAGSTTQAKLYGQEGEYDYRLIAISPEYPASEGSPLCPPDPPDITLIPPSVDDRPTKNIWCIFPIDGHEERLVTTNWTYGTTNYATYQRP